MFVCLQSSEFGIIADSAEIDCFTTTEEMEEIVSLEGQTVVLEEDELVYLNTSSIPKNPVWFETGNLEIENNPEHGQRITIPAGTKIQFERIELHSSDGVGLYFWDSPSSGETYEHRFSVKAKVVLEYN